ncbi:hypothetical protein ACHAXT_004291 [Thalassiosira profunda]
MMRPGPGPGPGGPLGPGPMGRRHVGAGGAGIHALGQISTAPTPAPAATGDLLGFEAPQEQSQQSHQAINANNVTVSITTTGGVAPNIAGLGKIEATGDIPNNAPSRPKRKVIYVPDYSCNGGLDTKFNHFARHARPSHLHNLLTADEYEREIRTLNDKIKKTRANAIDKTLLATGPLMVPLAFWGMRHGRQVKRKRKLIEEGCWEFNERMSMDSRNVQMVWNRSRHVGGGTSYLTIEEVEDADGNGGSKKVD